MKPVPAEIAALGEPGTEWYGGPVDRTSVSLRVSCGSADLGELREFLGAPFEHRGKVCTLQAPDALTGDLEAQLRWIVEATTPDLSSWAKVTSRWPVDVFCGLFLERSNRGIALSWETMRQLSERGTAPKKSMRTSRLAGVRPPNATEPVRTQRSTIQMKHRICKHLLSLFSFIATLTTLIAYFPRSVYAQDSVTPEPNSVLDKLEGEWEMTGNVANEEVTHDVYVDRVLKRQYVRIHELSREKDADGEPAYEAWIYVAWDKEKAEYVVMWLDNTATTNFAPEGVGHGKPDGDRIPFVWKSADGSGIHNTFKYDRASETWAWEIDNVGKSERASPFARLTLKRNLKR